MRAAVQVGVVGASGFVGAAATQELVRMADRVVQIRAPRLTGVDGRSASDIVALAKRTSESAVTLARKFEGLDVVVNAAGAALPDSDDVSRLLAANAWLPALVVVAATNAGVPRVVHISTAAVQGRQTPLTESPDVSPVTVYGMSKAIGEEAVMLLSGGRDIAVTIYRPTSVQGLERGVTHRLVQMANWRRVPLCQRGVASIPVALIENVAKAVAFLATAPKAPSYALHPWEGMTARSLMECFGRNPKFFPVPRGAWRGACAVLAKFNEAAARRLELLGFGQRQEAVTLAELGFHLGPQLLNYGRLGAEVRRRLYDV